MVYEKLIITQNTLVERGAVCERAIFKDVNGKIVIKSKEIFKDDTKLEMHSIMFKLNDPDAHGDIVLNPRVLDDACLDFMLNGNKVMKWTHQGKEVEAYTKELYIVPENHPIWNDPKYVGAIATVIKFNDEELYKYCRDNGYETSIEGYVEEAEEVTKDIEKTPLFKALYEKIINKFKFKEKENDMAEPEVKPEVTPEVKPEEVVEVKKEIPAEIVDYINSIATEIYAKYDEKYDRLLAMIEEVKTSSATEIEEVKKSYEKNLKEVRKDFVLDKVNTQTDAKPRKRGLCG